MQNSRAMDGFFIQKAVRAAVAGAGLTEPATCHTFRHFFASHLLEVGCDVHMARELFEHKDMTTAMVYTHILNGGVRSPVDAL